MSNLERLLIEAVANAEACCFCREEGRRGSEGRPKPNINCAQCQLSIGKAVDRAVRVDMGQRVERAFSLPEGSVSKL